MWIKGAKIGLLVISGIFFIVTTTHAEKNKSDKISPLTRYVIELYDGGQLVNTYEAQRIIEETKVSDKELDQQPAEELSQTEYFVKHRGHRDPFAEEKPETVTTQPCVTFEIRERARLIPTTICGTYVIKKMR